MAWELTGYTLAAFASVALFAVILLVGIREDWYSESPVFVLLLLTATLWAVFAGISLGFTAFEEKFRWLKFGIAMSGFVPPLFLVFTLRWAGYGDVLTWPRLTVLFTEALAFLVAVLTNGWHGLLWADASLPPPEVSPSIELTLTTLYHAHSTFAYLVIMLGLTVLVSIYLNSSSLHNRQAGLMLLGALPPLVSNAAYTMNASPIPHLDLTPFTFVVTGAMYGYALFHFDLLERTPIAQQRAIELVGDGLLVVDATGEIEDGNEVARRILDFENHPKQDVADVLSVDEVTDLHGTIHTVRGVDGRHAYDTLVSELTNNRGQFTGYAVVFRDVTDRYEYEQRLEVANRVLRHNLRNDMNVILGNAQIIREGATDSRLSEYARNIESKAEGLVSVSEKARELSTLRHVRRDDQRSVDVGSLLSDMLEEFESTNPDVVFDFSCPDDVTVDIVTSGGFEVAVSNLIENAIEHNDSDDPRVDVDVESRPDATRVTVRDNGPGLPEPEQALLQEGTQTPIQHSEGLGLWLTNWVVTAAGGSVTYESTLDGGTTITLSFQATGRPSPD